MNTTVINSPVTNTTVMNTGAPAEQSGAAGAPAPATPERSATSKSSGGWLHVITRRSPLAWLLIGFVRAWRAVISPLYGDVCKFYPTCSSYGLTALQLHGAVKGSWLIVRRLVRCHPWSLGGYDPVPGAHEHHFPSQGDRDS